jgi:hypothetical protein
MKLGKLGVLRAHLGTRERSTADMLDGSRIRLGVDGGGAALPASDDDSFGPAVGTKKPDSDAGWWYGVGGWKLKRPPAAADAEGKDVLRRKGASAAGVCAMTIDGRR